MHAAALPPSVLAAVLAAAVTHAIWNAIAHGIKDQVLAFGLLGAGSIIVCAPLVAIARSPLPACWPYLLGSVLIHVLYTLLLMRCYRHGQFGQVYPLARGTSPLVVTVLAATFAAERPSVPQVLGVLVISCGLGVLVFAGWRSPGRGPAPSRTALLAAGATGLTIASYMTVDGLGVRLSGSPVGYVGWLMLLESMFVPGWALARRRHEVVSGAGRRALLSGLSGGALAVLAYGLVLWAQTRGALAPIAALRESSLIFGAVIGTVVFREPFGRSRTAATVLVVTGVLLLNTA